jgi:ADP-ribosylglycohydrolase
VDAVRANILAGGDNASRSVLLGALLAAQEGAGAIPAEWKQKTRLFSEYEAIADQILALRG